jgi:hypothetical protein
MNSLFYRRTLIVLQSFLLLFFHFSSHAQCVEGDCKNGNGKVIYPDYSQYTGLFENGLRKQGILTYKSGDIYEGGFSKNKREGYGKYTYKSGEEFKGYYAGDQKIFGIYGSI